LAAPPTGKYYHGVYPGGRTGDEDDITPADLSNYERTVGRHVAWVYFSNNWFHDRAFPRATAQWIREHGSVPYIRLMLRSNSKQGRAESRFTLSAIANARFDADLERWADEARVFGSPLLVEWGTEMNGKWFSWNGRFNHPNGAEQFRRAFRHIVELTRQRKALNITWVFHVNAEDDPDEDWNRFENYYPGSDVVDWFGISLYAATRPDENSWTRTVPTLDETIERLVTLDPTKPIVLSEFGAPASNRHGDAGQWADEALGGIVSGRWPALRGFSWWNESWENDDLAAHNTVMKVERLPGVAAAFRKYVSDPRVLDAPITH
jgi:beta-mannanase